MPHGHVAKKVAAMQCGLFGLDVDKDISKGICFPDRWTWYMTTYYNVIVLEPSTKFYHAM